MISRPVFTREREPGPRGDRVQSKWPLGPGSSFRSRCALASLARETYSRSRRLSQAAIGMLLMLPAVLLLALLMVYPVLYGVWISFFNKHSFFPEQTFIGFDNYLFLLRDPEFWAAVRLGLVYAISTIVLQIVLGLAAALLLNELFPGRGLLRAIVIFPYVVPTVVAVIV